MQTCHRKVRRALEGRGSRFFLVLVVLLSAPLYSSAEPIVLSKQCPNSSVRFGLSGVTFNNSPPCFGSLDNGTDVRDGAVAFGTSGSLFIGQELMTDDGGAVLGSHYRYSGGTLSLFVSVDVAFGVPPVIGSVELPIESLDVFAAHGGRTPGVEVYAKLGAGLFDPALATALGVGRHITGGTLSDPFLYVTDGSDYLTPLRRAGEGAPTIEVTIPEPSLGMLLLASAAICRRRLARISLRRWARARPG